MRDAGKDAYADAVEHAGNLKVSYVYQTYPRGLGDAVHTAASKTKDEPFFVLLGDVVVPDNRICERLKEVSEAHGNASVLAVLPVPEDMISRFGIVGGKETEPGVIKIDTMVEKPKPEDAPSNLSIFGRYLFTPRIQEILAHTKPGVGGEIQLTDAMIELLGEEDMYAVVIDENDGYDVGTVDTWAKTNAVLFAERK